MVKTLKMIMQLIIEEMNENLQVLKHEVLSSFAASSIMKHMLYHNLFTHLTSASLSFSCSLSLFCPLKWALIWARCMPCSVVVPL